MRIGNNDLERSKHLAWASSSGKGLEGSVPQKNLFGQTENSQASESPFDHDRKFEVLVGKKKDREKLAYEGGSMSFNKKRGKMAYNV